MEKKTFRVLRREVWVQGVIVEAESEEEAKTMVADGKGENDEDSFEYSHNLNKDHLTAEPVE